MKHRPCYREETLQSLTPCGTQAVRPLNPGLVTFLSFVFRADLEAEIKVGTKLPVFISASDFRRPEGKSQVCAADNKHSV